MRCPRIFGYSSALGETVVGGGLARATAEVPAGGLAAGAGVAGMLVL